MQDLVQKLENLLAEIKLVKAQNGLPSLPSPKPITVSIKPQSTKASAIPGIKPNSKKNPKKVAEQLKNAEVQKLNMPVMKSNEIKPVIDGEKVNTYDATANISRKQTRTGEVVPGVGRNQGVRQYTTSGSSNNAAHEKAQAKIQRKKSLESVRTLKDMTPEEQEAIKAKYNQK